MSQMFYWDLVSLELNSCLRAECFFMGKSNI